MRLLRFLFVLFVFGICLSNAGLSQKDSSDGKWRLQMSYGHGVTNSLYRYYAQPGVYQSRLAHNFSIGLRREVIPKFAFWNVKLSYYDRGVREEVYLNDPLIVPAKKGLKNNFVSLTMAMGTYSNKYWSYKVELGPYYLVSSEQFDLENQGFNGVRRLGILVMISSGRDFNILETMKGYVEGFFNYQLQRPMFWVGGVSIGFYLKQADLHVGRPSFED